MNIIQVQRSTAADNNCIPERADTAQSQMVLVLQYIVPRIKQTRKT
jgi:hypothetical protein